ncbi:MAG: acyltransferase [Pseudomonas fluorescens]|nr:MAG: acyltransferase [Pseudomonas fluorescens]
MSVDTSRQNNLDFIRLFAAFMVLFAHSFALTGTRHVGGIDTGTLGVLIFFSASGFLITRSYARNPNWKTFLKARLLRIIPALIPLVLLCAFVLGPLVTTLPLSEYFAERHTYSYLKNAIPVNMQYPLPGVFSTNPNTAVNGSLWTLSHELKCYLAVLILGVCGILRSKWLRPLSVLAFVLGCVVLMGAEFAGNKGITMQMAFLSGAVYYVWWKQIPQNISLAIAATLILAAGIYFGYMAYAWYFVGPYALLFWAYYKPLKLWRFTQNGDISYGVYIYAFPIQQWLVWYTGGTISAWANFICTAILVVPFAWASWHGLEKRALALK